MLNTGNNKEYKESKTRGNQENYDLGLTGHSNSRLSVQNGGQNLKIGVSFDRITVVGYWITSREKFVKRHVESDPRINLRDTGYDRFKCHGLDNKIYVEYDRKQAEAMKRSEVRVEFNPNELTDEEKGLVQTLFLNNMRGKDFSRIDLAFDVNIDLKDYYAMTDKALKKTIFFGRDGKPETKYFGVRDSDRYIRIYNKKKQLSEVKEKEIGEEHLWRIEFELKRSMTDNWNKCFDDLSVIKPAWKTIEKQQERAMVHMLLHDESEWAELGRSSKYKYRKMLKEIADVDIADELKYVLNKKHKLLRDELEGYIAISHHDNLYDFEFHSEEDS